MTVTYDDIITEESIRREVLEEIEYPLQFRQAFDQLDVSGVDNDTIKIPRDSEKMGEPEQLAYGGEFPRDKEGMELEEVTVEKFGQSVELVQEAIDDSMFNVVARNVNKQALRMEQFLNRKAFEYLDANLHSNAPAGDQDGEFTFSDITDAKKILQDEQFNPDWLIVSTQAERDLLHSPDFTRATDLADDTLRRGQVGRVAGLDVVVDTSGLIGASNSHGYLVDTDNYGWEVVKEDVQTNSFTDQNTHSEIYQIWTRRTWHATRPECAVKIEG